MYTAELNNPKYEIPGKEYVDKIFSIHQQIKHIIYENETFLNLKGSC